MLNLQPDSVLSAWEKMGGGAFADDPCDLSLDLSSWEMKHTATVPVPSPSPAATHIDPSIFAALFTPAEMGLTFLPGFAPPIMHAPRVSSETGAQVVPMCSSASAGSLDGSVPSASHPHPHDSDDLHAAAAAAGLCDDPAAGPLSHLDDDAALSLRFGDMDSPMDSSHDHDHDSCDQQHQQHNGQDVVKSEPVEYAFGAVPSSPPAASSPTSSGEAGLVPVCSGSASPAPANHAEAASTATSGDPAAAPGSPVAPAPAAAAAQPAAPAALAPTAMPPFFVPMLPFMPMLMPMPFGMAMPMPVAYGGMLPPHMAMPAPAPAPAAEAVKEEPSCEATGADSESLAQVFDAQPSSDCPSPSPCPEPCAEAPCSAPSSLPAHLTRQASAALARAPSNAAAAAAAAGAGAYIRSRAECLERYREKKARRLYTKKIRYQLRKINADKRPRIKGRFVKKEELEGFLAAQRAGSGCMGDDLDFSALGEATLMDSDDE
ncbi:hypothetical protein HYH03_014134 [Edaphochlamys debaryana]|uniref:CCT domain-containing protein n=1 Tax=Edaphochlamys debaryana TaxID=47281 RepID=A0A835XX02_9CHLO|nr:hypothetical protein HYH03_014134 [Edaphochlamys debaryana]|eukprot:KAG2487294.1 hypothetical protein HYH03_014134 [Edaphochlamys debaryana]